MIGTLVDFRAYADARGWGEPTAASNPDAEAALLRASDYIRFSYVRRFAAGHDEASPNVEPATYEAALLELKTPGFFSKTYTPGERKILTEAKGIKWQVIGDGDASGAAPVSTRIDDMLADYLTLPVGLLSL